MLKIKKISYTSIRNLSNTYMAFVGFTSPTSNKQNQVVKKEKQFFLIEMEQLLKLKFQKIINQLQLKI